MTASDRLEAYRFKVGDRVKRAQVNAFKYHREMTGTIVEITYDGRNKIKWDEKNTTGQQHSTVLSKFLVLDRCIAECEKLIKKENNE